MFLFLYFKRFFFLFFIPDHCLSENQQKQSIILRRGNFSYAFHVNYLFVHFNSSTLYLISPLSPLPHACEWIMISVRIIKLEGTGENESENAFRVAFDNKTTTRMNVHTYTYEDDLWRCSMVHYLQLARGKWKKNKNDFLLRLFIHKFTTLTMFEEVWEESELNEMKIASS